MLPADIQIPSEVFHRYVLCIIEPPGLVWMSKVSMKVPVHSCNWNHPNPQKTHEPPQHGDFLYKT